MDIRPTVRVAGFSHAGERLRWLALLALVAVAAGVWLRFSMLPTKYVYRDEVWTSMHIAGNSIEDVRALHVQNATAGDLVRTFQTPRTRGTADTVRALATTDPQHPPLYYLLARGWAGEGTSSITRERALSALFGILLIAAMYWLALALFKRTGTALLCAAFVAASPYQAVFSDEVREWSLFMLLAVIATALLVKALEASSIWNWVAYGVAMLLTAYCSVLSLGVFAAHAIAVLGLRPQVRQRLRFAVSAAAAFLLYVPWLLDMTMRWERANANAAYAAMRTGPLLYAAKLIFILGAFVFDGEYASVRLVLVAVLAVAAAAYAVASFAREAPLEARWIVFSLALVPLVFFVGSDVVLHSSRALQARYLLMTCVGFDLAAAYALSTPTAGRAQSVIRTCAAVLLIAAGIGSIWEARSHAAWWDNNDSAPIASAAAIAARTPHAVVLFDDTFAALLFSNQAISDTKLAFNVGAAFRRGRVVYGFDLHASTLQQLHRIAGVRAQQIRVAGARSAFRAGGDDGASFWRFER